MRRAMAAGDETFEFPKADGDGSSSESDNVSENTCAGTVKSEAESEDSLMQELAEAGNVTLAGKYRHLRLFESTMF